MALDASILSVTSFAGASHAGFTPATGTDTIVVFVSVYGPTNANPITQIALGTSPQVIAEAYTDFTAAAGGATSNNRALQIWWTQVTALMTGTYSVNSLTSNGTINGMTVVCLKLGNVTSTTSPPQPYFIQSAKGDPTSIATSLMSPSQSPNVVLSGIFPKAGAPTPLSGDNLTLVDSLTSTGGTHYVYCQSETTTGAISQDYTLPSADNVLTAAFRLPVMTGTVTYYQDVSVETVQPSGPYDVTGEVDLWTYLNSMSQGYDVGGNAMVGTFTSTGLGEGFLNAAQNALQPSAVEALTIETKGVGIQAGPGFGTPPPTTGQLWPRGRK